MEMKLIVLVVIVLVAIAVAQLMRVYELTSKIRNRREEDIDLRVNNINAMMMIAFLAVFFGSAVYMLFKYGNGMLPEAASIHGQDVDWLFNINWVIVFTVFFIVNGVLFVFAYKYAYDPNRTAYYFPHDNKLEMLWTVVPAGALAVIIILGLMTWNKITGKPSENAVVVELYAEQFNWTARYSGDDNKLGYADYKLVTTWSANPNPLGVITTNNIEWRLKELDSTINAMHTDLAKEENLEVVYSVASLEKMRKKVEKLERIRERVALMQTNYTDSTDVIAADDFIAKELFLIKDQEYQFIMRSRDVIHSAYFPHFRAQMNCVPGQRTKLKFTPIFTTAEMREKTGNPEFNYILMCNKICGESHSNMKMSVVVGTAEEFKKWQEEGNTSLVVASVN
ncbi:MAG: cytochrome c oxidase subunit II [Crocinitomicaceae bacterium]|nr:cytochrome c oxidase subunit II [Crocinitomicaceae bacterium]